MLIQIAADDSRVYIGRTNLDKISSSARQSRLLIRQSMVEHLTE